MSEIEREIADLKAKVAKREEHVGEQAIGLLHRALEMKAPDSIAAVYVLLANIEQKIKFNFNQARTYAITAKDFIQEKTPIDTKIALAEVLGLSSQRLRDSISAQNYFWEAITLFEGIKNPTLEQQTNHAYVNFYMGTLYLNIGLHQFSQDFYQKANRIFNEVQNEKGILACKQAEARNYFHQEEWDKALVIYQALIGDHEATGADWMDVVLDYAAQIYIKKEDYQQAEDLAIRAFNHRDKSGDELKKGYSYFTLARIAYRTGYKSKGDSFFEKLKEQYDKFPFLYTKEMILDISWDLYGERGDFEKSYDYFKQVKQAWTDSDTVETIMQNVFQAERRKQEVARGQAEELKMLNLEMEGHAKLLEVSNKDLKNFANITSHDLREPLRMVSTYMRILESKIKDKLSEEEKQFLHFAVDGSNRMDEMISRILQTAKGDELALKLVSLNKVLDVVKSNLQNLLAQKRAILEVEELPWVLGDEILLVQIFQNLVTNAVKYNVSEAPKVKVIHEKKGMYHLISTIDNGVGIPEADRAKVFELFARVSNGSGAEGTGIGLATVKSLVEKMKGNIQIESNPQGGAIFKIQFPVVN